MDGMGRLIAPVLPVNQGPKTLNMRKFGSQQSWQQKRLWALEKLSAWATFNKFALHLKIQMATLCLPITTYFPNSPKIVPFSTWHTLVRETGLHDRPARAGFVHPLGGS